VARFTVWGAKYLFKGQDFCFIYFNKKISGHNKILVGTKNWGELPPNIPPRGGPALD